MHIFLTHAAAGKAQDGADGNVRVAGSPGSHAAGLHSGTERDLCLTGGGGEKRGGELYSR